MSDCDKVGKWIGGCKFEARYDNAHPDESLQTLVKYASDVPAYVIKLLVNKSTYVRDVCVRCGKTIERSAD